MAAFEYKAMTPAGQMKKGLMEGDSERQVRQMLREQNLTPVELKSIEQKKNTSKGAVSQSLFAPKIQTSDLALATRQLYTLLDAGTPLTQALQSISQQAESKLMQRFLANLHTRVSEGYSLAHALEKSNYRVGQDFIATIRAGEESGHLDKVLSRLADAIEQRDQLNKKMKTALIYPILMVVVAVIIVFFLMVYVVPKVVGVFDNMNQTLPPLTQGLLTVSEFIQAQWGWILVLLAAAIVGFKMMMRQSAWRYRVHQLLMRTPGVKRFVIYSATARWSRTVGVLLSSGVAATDALKISAEVMSLDPMKHAVEKMVSQVREGKRISVTMQEAGFFPPLLLNLVQTGESGGELDNMLLKGAVHYEQAVENAAGTLVSVLEPMLIIVMGGVVLTIVLAIMMPIFEMNQMVG
ncbi:type II secretion system inner membrane protein GspF [Thiomicrorhabdus sp. ZW0627]|uniref:type II secretion system inner membrane protein GspF n=1 Tax=Thiomicrorhabdus sp. ZW0627 TaxID=3039774 RepID=UPI0024363754|nr:type II secretion system inner membrane protein GspF [Thiomicrorhabdus sp. ZW0627]MDG6773663.1 type II secretion system inner membrane protein GspF [Thiomicrorhabdus sp. ZW0627]